MTKRLAVLIVFLSPVLLFGIAAGQEATSGAIEGTVTDARGAALAGATVTLTSAQGTKTETSDSNGRFRFPYLPAGVYSLRATLQGYTTAELTDLDVRLGSRLSADIEMVAGSMETVTVLATATTIDYSTTTTGTTIDSEMMQSIPLGRTFANAVALAPGVVGSGIDDSNPSISGASGLENTYVVDGVNINNTGYGSLGSYSIVLGSLGTGVNYDYIEEVQVKTGGYEPEYGETLGGFVNLVTKTGGNLHRGSAFVYTQNSGTEGSRERDTRNDATFDEVGFSSTDFGFEFGGPIKQDEIFYYGAFDPTFLTITRRSAQATGFDHELDVDREIYNYAGNVKWLAHPKHTLTLSAFGDPSKGKMGAQREDALGVANPEDRFSEITYGGHNAVARWQGELNDNTFIEASIAYHTDKFEEDLNVNLPSGTDRTQFVTPDPDTTVVHRYGGPGFVGRSKSQNTQYRVKFSNHFEGAGEHSLRFGVEFQDIGYDNTANYSGAPGQTIPDSVSGGLGGTPFGSQAAATGFIWQIAVPDSADLPSYPSGRRFRVSRIRTGQITTETTNHYLAFFLSDTWRPVDWISIMAGVRYEENTLIGDLQKFSWNNNWGPRANVVVDPMRDNRTKLSFSYGRFFGKIPSDLAVRALGSEVTHIVDYDAADVTFDANGTPTLPAPALAKNMRTFGLDPTIIDPDSKVTYQDEYILSAERDVMPQLNVGVSYLYRTLGRTLEDVALVPYDSLLVGVPFGSYFITNPTEEQGFPKPSRNYHAVTLKAEKRASASQPWRAAASYTWSRLKGNYEGYFRRDNGQSDPFITSLFDFPYLDNPVFFQHIINDGFLPNDRTHVFNAFGSYTLKVPQGLTVGASLKVQSGVPLTRLGYNEAYGSNGEFPLEERGGSGRSPTTTNIGLHGHYDIRVGTRRISVIADVFNLLNQQKGVNFDQRAELDGTGPDNVNPDFGAPMEAYEQPLSFRFALRVIQ